MSNAYAIRQAERKQEYEKEYNEWVASLPPEERDRLREMGLGEPLLDKRASGGSECDLADSPVASYDPRDDAEPAPSPLDDSEPDESRDEKLWTLVRTIMSELASSKDDGAGLKLECLCLVAGVQFSGNSFEDIARKFKVGKMDVAACCESVVSSIGFQPSGASTSEALQACATVSAALPSVDRTAWRVIGRLLGEVLHLKRPGLTIDCICLVSGIEYEGDSMSGIGRKHGVTRAAVSKRCVTLCESIGLPPSRAMRSESARAAYADARNRSLGKI